MFKSLLKGPLIIIFVVLSLSAYGKSLPDVSVANEFGREGRLLSHFDDKTLLVMGYYKCRHMCNFVVKELNEKLVNFKNYPKVVFFGIDEFEGPRDALRLGKRIIGKARTRWTFLVSDKDSIQEVARTLNFEMKRDVVSNTMTHEMGVYAVNQQGEFSKLNEMEMKESDLEISSSESMSPMSAIKTFCSEFDPRKSKSGMLLLRMLSVGSGVFLTFAFMGFMHLRRKRA